MAKRKLLLTSESHNTNQFVRANAGQALRCQNAERLLQRDQ